MARLLRVRASARDEGGVGIPMALFVILIVFALGATWSQLGIHNLTLSSHEREREQALDAAEAGINEAMSNLTVDASYAGGSGTLHGQSGEYDVTVTPIDTGDPADMRRQILATGRPITSAEGVVTARRLEAEVDLETTDGFDFGLFAGGGNLGGANHMTVNGDVYGSDGIALANNSDVNGDVVTPAWVTTEGNTLIAGDVRADGNVTLENSTTTVRGSVFSRGDVVVRAKVSGDVQAGGTVTVGTGGSVAGTISQYSPPPPVRQESLPTFTWNSSNYSPPPTTWSSASTFSTDWSAKALGGIPFNGHHRITSTPAITLDQRWKMDADVTIVTDGKLTLSREVTNAGSTPLNLVLISLSTSGIEFTNNVTIPDSIRVLLFAPNGPVAFKSLKHFTGAVYGKSVTVDQNFTLTWARPEAPGFSWTNSTIVHHRVIVRVLREMVVPVT